ncbi:hypothetical protein BOSEA1005_30578 [Hyphomicrobiales bacterium]|nr:hypothetical protein BOSEA1005_30578 [Hyphomicrobiales bacterium]
MTLRGSTALLKEFSFNPGIDPQCARHALHSSALRALVRGPRLRFCRGALGSRTFRRGRC